MRVELNASGRVEDPARLVAAIREYRRQHPRCERCGRPAAYVTRRRVGGGLKMQAVCALHRSAQPHRPAAVARTVSNPATARLHARLSARAAALAALVARGR